MHGKRSLDAHAETDLSYGKGLVEARTLAADDDALEDLDALTGAFDDSYVDLYGVAGAKCGNIVAKRVAVNEVSGVHESGPFRITGFRSLAVSLAGHPFWKFGEYRLVDGAQSPAALDEVRSPRDRAMKRLGSAPPRDARVVPRAEDLRHAQPREPRRASCTGDTRAGPR